MSKLMERMRHRAPTTTGPVDQRTALLRPPERNWKQKFADFFWDKKKKMCLTRTPLNWLSILFYYFLFVSVVILIFYISMLISEAVASSETNRPQYVLDDSWIGSTPSINFFPMRGTRNLIWLSPKRSYSEYVNKISEELEWYKKQSKKFNATQFGACAKSPYGYDAKTPCLFFRMNRLLLWKPAPYKKGDKLPKDIPKSVAEKISSSGTPKIWMSCNGTTAKDRDHIQDAFFHYENGPGFDITGFPFKKQPDFIDPIIAMQFKDDKPQKILYSFTCKLWAKKLNPDKSKVDVVYYFE